MFSLAGLGIIFQVYVYNWHRCELSIYGVDVGFWFEFRSLPNLGLHEIGLGKMPRPPPGKHFRQVDHVEQERTLIQFLSLSSHVFQIRLFVSITTQPSTTEGQDPGKPLYWGRARPIAYRGRGLARGRACLTQR